MADTALAGAPLQEAVEDGEALDPRFVQLQRLLWRIFVSVATLVSFAIVSIVLVAADTLRPWIAGPLVVTWAAAVGLLAWHAGRWPRLEYEHTRYRVSADGLEIRRGVYWRTVTRVPRSRVQHTDVSQGPLERRYGLGTLVLYTAGTNHARVVLPGLAYERALALRDRLKPEGAGDAV